MLFRRGRKRREWEKRGPERLRRLFEPIRIGRLKLKNRILLPALGLSYTEDGHITDRLWNFYGERARGGAGLIGFNLAPVPGCPPGVAGIYQDSFLPELQRFTDMIHLQKALTYAQFGATYAWTFAPGAPPELVSPSGISLSRQAGAPPRRALSRSEIHQIIEELGRAALRARQAGFDAVEYMAGTGYLLSQFLSPLTNQRSDEYGGSLRNRMRFLLEVIAHTRERTGSAFPILVRLSGDQFMEGGYTLNEVKLMASALERAGVAALALTPGWHESPIPMMPMSVPPGSFVYLADEVKKGVRIPVAAGTRLQDPVLAERVLQEGKADLVYMARALIADPELPLKARQGRLEDIIPCIACNYCFDGTSAEAGVGCAVNGRTGKEADYDYRPAATRKRVMVIGGGPAGMEAALVAARRGHAVMLFEKEEHLGGKLGYAAVGPFKTEINKFTQFLLNQIAKSGVEVRLSQEVTPELVLENHPDAVVVAAGAEPRIPDIPGALGWNVVTALDVLSGRKEPGGKVVIVGGEQLGCEVADFLALRGKEITLLARRSRIGDDLYRANRWAVLERLRRAGVKTAVGVDVVEITERGVRALREGKEVEFEGDTVVLAAGMSPQRRLGEELKGKVPEIHFAGDCIEARTIAQAVADGMRIGHEL